MISLIFFQIKIVICATRATAYSEESKKTDYNSVNVEGDDGWFAPEKEEKKEEEIPDIDKDDDSDGEIPDIDEFDEEDNIVDKVKKINLTKKKKI